MKIPLPDLMRHWREAEFDAGDTPLMYRLGLKAWAAVAKRPRLYHALVRVLMPVLGAFGRRRGAFPLAAVGRRLDPASRPRRAAGPHVPGAVGRHQGGGAAMSGGDRPAAMRSSPRSARASAPTIRRSGAQPSPSASARRRRRWCRSAPRDGRDELRQLFRTFLEGQSATVIEAASAAEVPAAVAGYLRSTNLPLRVRVGDDAYLEALPWKSEPALERKRGPAAGDDEVGLSHAAAAVAETGTLVLASGADNPVTITFLPETSIVVVEDKDLVGGYEGAWEKVRARFGAGAMPRTVNFVSGPSRTADIGGQLVMGAHGPRRLCVMLVRG